MLSEITRPAAGEGVFAVEILYPSAYRKKEFNMKKIQSIIFSLLLVSISLLSTRVATAQLKATLEGHTDLVWSVAFRPNGVMLASASWDQTVRLWNVNTGQLLHTLTGHTDEALSVAFSPDGQTLASASWDGTIHLWNPQNGKLKRTLTEHRGGVTSVAFSPDGQTLASGSWDRTIRLWNPHTLRQETTLIGHTDYVLSVAVFSRWTDAGKCRWRHNNTIMGSTHWRTENDAHRT